MNWRVSRDGKENCWGKKWPSPSHFSHISPLSYSGPCAHNTLLFHFVVSITPVRSSHLLGLLFHWPCTTCCSLINTLAFSFLHLYLSYHWDSMSPHYNAVLANTLKTCSTVILLHISDKPQPWMEPSIGFYHTLVPKQLRNTRERQQGRWVITLYVHDHLLQQGFCAARQSYHVAGCSLCNYLLISNIFYFLQTLGSCPSHLCGISLLMTVPTKLEGLYSSFSCFLV